MPPPPLIRFSDFRFHCAFAAASHALSFYFMIFRHAAAMPRRSFSCFTPMFHCFATDAADVIAAAADADTPADLRLSPLPPLPKLPPCYASDIFAICAYAAAFYFACHYAITRFHSPLPPD
jgi:hypothetical protein